MKYLLDLDYVTDRQKEYVKAYLEEGTYRKAAKRLGVACSTIVEAVGRAKAIAAKRGVSPDHGMVKEVPQGFAVSGVSTNYNADGEMVQQWVKTSLDRVKMGELMQASLSSMKDELPKYAPAAYTKGGPKDLANCYILTDYHFGMLAWDEECGGGDWDLSIAEKTLINWITAGVKTAPEANTGILANIGDLMHFDGMSAVTPTHGHILDADSRFQKVVRVAIRALRYAVDLMLTKYEKVHIIMATGNHDLASSVWLREVFSHVYSDDPRVTVDLNPDVYYAFEWGQTAIFFHHGHRKKPANVSDVFVSKYRELFGRTKPGQVYAHMGHLHHVDAKENNLMVVEQHRTLAAPDSHAAGGGWLSGRSSNVITYHKDFGEVARVTISPAMCGAPV